MPPRGGLLLGSGRTTRLDARSARDSLVEFESLAIFEEGAALIYRAEPSGQAAVRFTADTVRSGLVVFRNPRHDFPQRIRYAARGGDSLIASLHGPGPRGTTRSITIRYGRVTCDGGR